ncbi:phage baseplate assembly protein V [Bosea sp. (in: a-proteobacteria)]|uniref:phage baseplate assembly protein V n=1 Tax=Bosea sp. (in: a-proteobacteria) TaxID=1871050 RepID=UPI001AC338B7|nr:phage baseplate assembly protein V [Bosea sp. (in: a-proteobacteria)]MBN9444379.1 phage baseplate assembly protein V [Bosea sp. (in: a-proteobacteria)]
MRAVAELINRISKLETRLGGVVRLGSVSHVDPVKQRMRVRLGGTDAQPFLSPWVPYGQTAGAMKFHNPPSVGQQFALFSDNGNMRQAVALPFTWSDQNTSPSQLGNEHVMTFGSVKVSIRDKQLLVEVGGAKFDITDQKITLELGGTRFEWTQSEFNAAASLVNWTTG